MFSYVEFHPDRMRPRGSRSLFLRTYRGGASFMPCPGGRRRSAPRMASAISSGDFAPMSRPMGPWMRAIWASLTPASRSRWSRLLAGGAAADRADVAGPDAGARLCRAGTSNLSSWVRHGDGGGARRWQAAPSPRRATPPAARRRRAGARGWRRPRGRRSR